MNDESKEEIYNIMSQSSTSSRTSGASSTLSVLTTYTTQVNSNSTPKTLKFILNLAMVIFVLMAVSSSIILSIALENEKACVTSI